MSENLSSFLGNAESIPKRVMPIFFLIDTSGSMEGKKIGAVNSAIEELIPDLRHLSESQADSEIKLSVLKFSTGCEWVTPALMSLDAFDDWEPLDANGLTDLGAAFLELNDKLSKNGFMDRGAASSGSSLCYLYLLLLCLKLHLDAKVCFPLCLQGLCHIAVELEARVFVGDGREAFSIRVTGLCQKLFCLLRIILISTGIFVVWAHRCNNGTRYLCQFPTG